MKCIYCQGQMKRGVAPFHVDRKGYHLMLDKVPAWVCSQCGETYFAEAEVDAIQDVMQMLDEKTDRLEAV